MLRAVSTTNNTVDRISSFSMLILFEVVHITNVFKYSDYAFISKVFATIRFSGVKLVQIAL